MGPHPAVAAIRLAVRRTLADLAPDSLVLVACSGGGDSMALATATAWEAPRAGLRAGAVTVDHGLQLGSAARAADLTAQLRALGLDPVEALAVTVDRDGSGPEAAARTARYAALDDAAERHRAAAVLLGHNLDDQAETVLLGLARGSGSRSLSGMPAVGPSPARGGDTRRYRRPFLDLGRAQIREACRQLSVSVWDDPHNADPAYTRSRIRHEVLPVLEKQVKKGVIEALARTARLCRDDADALDSWAERAAADARCPEGGLRVEILMHLPPAVRRRILRRAALDAGSPAGALFAAHVESVDRLVTGWRGQGPLSLPGGIEAVRRCGTLVFRRPPGSGARQRA